jgi:hypothetical protein
VRAMSEWIISAIGRMSVAGADRKRPPSPCRSCGSTDRSSRLIGMVGTVALVTPPVRIGQQLLAYRLATALGLDAVDHGLQFLASVNGEHLGHFGARLVAMLELHQAAGTVGPQFLRDGRLGPPYSFRPSS